MSRREIRDQQDLYELVDAKHGRFLVNPNDVYIGRSMQMFGEFSELEVELLCQVLKSGSIIADIGANIGTHTVPLARHVGANGFVYSIEMQPLVFQTLCANIALNGLTNVDTRNIACGKEKTTFGFPEIDYSRSGNFGGVGPETFRGAHSRRTIEMRPFDSLQCKQLDLMKIDVEGAEIDVLIGADQTIRACRPILYVENDRPEKSEALIKHISGLGYRLWWHMPRLFNPKNWAGVSENPWKGVVSCNMVCLPSERPASVAGLVEIKTPDDHPLQRK